ncbi:MAG TPA: 3-hydroxyacyl-CoA dehydrogenase NAD-binding domain-containing protein [Gemmataceae bacterium]|jgi:3-hydroxyacyl-CoA dehydrogenase/enoyl-CoA hydratase/3-hydroxybutyryl-CoA epimerase|nr:3-hydroxyacyl-CoA dehydrogenase NAD-binding domain-containing protein [Gemmataceae bacterium]
MLYESAHVSLATEYRIATLTISGAGVDRPLVSRSVLRDLDAALAVAERHQGIDVLVLRGDRPGAFSAGPDLAELAADPAAASAVAALGQQVAARLAGLDAITVAEIDGPCRGGALELALACDLRLAAGHAGTRLGFPQVACGATPCWGGTVRLPRLVGLARALDMFLKGTKLSAAQARSAGLVQFAFPPSISRVEMDRLVLELQAAGKKPSPRRVWIDRLPGRRNWLLRRAWSIVQATTTADHKAPRELLRILLASIRGGEAEGLAAERAAIGRLARGLSTSGLRVDVGQDKTAAAHKPMHTIANLRIHVDPPAKPRDLAAKPIRRIGVVGGGTIGIALAQWAALHGCTVAIQEHNAKTTKLARERLARQFHRAVIRRLLPAEDLADRLAAIPVSSAWVGFEEADLVIEAVDEDLAVKSEILQEAERHVPPAAILATCSTAFTVRELQERLARPQRLLGLHVGHPAPAMRWVEVTAGPTTDPSVVARLRTWLRANGKRPLLVADRPGRVLGRVLLPFLHEAVLLAEEGYSVAAVDAAVRKFGLTWGPFQTMDAAGLDVILASLRAAAATVAGLSPPPILERLVAAGCRGKKSGAGFYRHNRLVNIPNSAMLPAAVNDRDLELGVRRQVTRLLTAAFGALGNGLIRHSDDLDGLLLAAGWPAFRGGPVEYAYRRGLPMLVRACDDLTRRFGPRFDPGKELRRRAGEPETMTLPFQPQRAAA